ncbi:MAG: DsbA family protein [Magnetovibrio sp.]|nr:DsbA family protein [Magnetovibrio sp.]
MSIYATTYTFTRETRRILAVVSIFLITAFAFAGAPTSAQAQMASFEDAKGEMSIGNADAPVTLHEYASLTCGHCANFHKNTLPKIKKQYIDTGKVRVVFHDFPLDALAMGAVMIARCSGPDRFADFTDMLFQTQSTWRDADNPLPALKTLAQFYGLKGDDVQTCLNNQDLLKSVQSNQKAASARHKIRSTPSFVLDGELIEGAQPFDNFKAALDKSLAAHQ